MQDRYWKIKTKYDKLFQLNTLLGYERLIFPIQVFYQS